MIIILGILILCRKLKMLLRNSERKKIKCYKFKLENIGVLNIFLLFSVIFGEAVITKCKKCTEKQKQNLDITVDWYTKNQPDKWNALVEKNIEDLKKKNSE